MNTYNNLPLFEISIDGIDLGMTAISIVDDPAVERDFICFKNESPIHFTSDSEHCITGVAIIADKPIYRRNGAYEYYVVFTKDVIKQIVEQYSREKLWNTVDLQHDGKHIGGVTMVEMYIKNGERGINPAGFEDVAEGSLFVTFKIEDENLWNDIVNGDALNGFSIEIYADMFKMEDSMDISVDSLLGDKKKS